MSNDAIRNSIRALVDEIVTAHDQLTLPVEADELADVRATIARIEARWRAMQPLPQPDPTAVANFEPAVPLPVGAGHSAGDHPSKQFADFPE